MFNYAIPRFCRLFAGTKARRRSLQPSPVFPPRLKDIIRIVNRNYRGGLNPHRRDSAGCSSGCFIQSLYSTSATAI